MTEQLREDSPHGRLRGGFDRDQAAYFEERWDRIGRGEPTWVVRIVEGESYDVYDYYVGRECVATLTSPWDRPGETEVTSPLIAEGQSLLAPQGLETAVAAVEQLFPPNLH